MKNVLNKNNWNAGTVQVHVEPPPIPIMKGKNNDKPDIFFVKIKLRRDPKSEILDLYGFKMAWTARHKRCYN